MSNLPPERVKFRAARLKSTPMRVEVIRADTILSPHNDWEWLEPEQSFEVVLP